MSHNLFVTLSTVAPPLRWRVHHISTTNGLPVLTECQHESSRGISANDIWNGFNCGLADEIVTSIRKKSSIWNKMSKKERKRFETDTKYANKLYAEHWVLEDIIQADINYDGIFVHVDDDCQAYVFTKWLDNINDE